ncbi:hypothetical protein SAMN05518845_115174 [Variovorax sp. YR750]|uniref:hypothetical protein n=1 Tax=Variovorax sp. YR750 TaxID=1884384 RepID=UPI0008BFFCC4|nr:hypothetical protein [Variovorax sp. YR750]SEM06355.1 hypothetical protein SAMN05518845_115174 [Variovorax sp. YR750]
MSLRLSTWGCAVAVLALSGCTAYPTEVTSETFETAMQGRYDPSKQALLADCIFDGWDTVMNYAIPSQARLVKRAWGYRVDAISLTNKLLIAELRDDGAFSVARMKERKMVTTLKLELDAATACLKRYGASVSVVEGN